jgi:hypothetical protein
MIQMAKTIYDPIYTFGNATLTEINTGNRVTITPTSTSNYLVCEMYIAANFHGTSNLQDFMWYDVTGTAVFAPSTVTTGSRVKSHCMYRGTSTDTNDLQYCYVRTVGLAPRTTSSVFTPYFSGQTADTFYINYNSNDSTGFGYNSPSVMTVSEVDLS